MFIFLSVWIAKSKRIVTLFASVTGFSWCLYHFYNPIFDSIYILSNEYIVLFCLGFLYILLVLEWCNQTIRQSD